MARVPSLVAIDATIVIRVPQGGQTRFKSCSIPRSKGFYNSIDDGTTSVFIAAEHVTPKRVFRRSYLNGDVTALRNMARIPAGPYDSFRERTG